MMPISRRRRAISVSSHDNRIASSFPFPDQDKTVGMKFMRNVGSLTSGGEVNFATRSIARMGLSAIEGGTFSSKPVASLHASVIEPLPIVMILAALCGN